MNINKDELLRLIDNLVRETIHLAILDENSCRDSFKKQKEIVRYADLELLAFIGKL